MFWLSRNHEYRPIWDKAMRGHYRVPEDKDADKWFFQKKKKKTPEKPLYLMSKSERALKLQRENCAREIKNWDECKKAAQSSVQTAILFTARVLGNKNSDLNTLFGTLHVVGRAEQKLHSSREVRAAAAELVASRVIGAQSDTYVKYLNLELELLERELVASEASSERMRKMARELNDRVNEVEGKLKNS